MCKNCFKKYFERKIKQKLRETNILKKHEILHIIGPKSLTLEAVYNVISSIKRKKKNIILRKIEYDYIEDLFSIEPKDNELIVLPIECIGVLLLGYFSKTFSDLKLFRFKNLLCKVSEYESSIYLDKNPRKMFFRREDFKSIEEFFEEVINFNPKYIRSILTSFEQLKKLNIFNY